MSNEEKVYLGGLWKNTSSAGNEYYSGGFGIGGMLLVFPNRDKRSDNHPDMNVYVVPKKKRDGDAAPPPSDDDIPF